MMLKHISYFFYGISGVLLALFIIKPVSAHELSRLHEHGDNNTYQHTPRPVHIRFTAPLIAGDAIRVVTRFQAVDSAHSLISAQRQWAGTSNDQAYKNIKAFSDNGEPLLLKKTGKKQWRVNTQRGQWVEIHYSIPANTNAHSAGTQYRAILNKYLFHAIGQLFLVLPDDPMTEPLKVSVEWRAFDGINWETVQAVAANPKNKYEILSKSALLSSIFMAGDLQIYQSQTPYGPVKIAMQKNDWHFKGEEFATLAQQIVQSEREFFAQKIDNNIKKPFLISLVEVEKGLNGLSIGGISLHSSFAMFANAKAKLMQTDFSKPNATIGFVLAHEMMHQWVGIGLKTSENPEALGYWFTEGFSDYFSLQVLYRSQLITLDNYMEMLNGLLKSYWLNPKRNIKNKKIAADFWQDHNTRRIPYLRGFLIALLSDQRMRIGSDIRLRELLLSLLVHTDNKTDAKTKIRTNQSAVSNQSLLATLEAHVGKALGSHLRKVVNKGQTIKMDLDLLSPCLSIENKALGDYDPGFDLEGSKTAQQIKGLKTQTGAYQAGLRNGQKIAGWAFSGSAADKASVSIYTDQQGTVQAFEFYPVSDTTLVPQASIMQRESCSGIL